MDSRLERFATARITDVVVLGAGLAGHCAALEAADAGAAVLLAEKMPAPGGSTLSSAGSLAFAGTDAQRAAGVHDTSAALETELQRAAGGKAQAELVHLYAERQAESYDWLKRQGVVFHDVSLSSGTSVPRTHPTRPHQLIGALHQRVVSHPRITYVSSLGATRLARSDRGSVARVDFTHEHEPAAVSVRCGVVVATGGFTRSPALIQRFSPELADAPAWGGEGNTGDGLTMAWELGADLVDMGYVTATFGVALNHYPDTSVLPGDELLLRMAMYRGGIAVNLRAARFADESKSYKHLSTACLAQPKGIAIQIFDQAVMNQSVPQPTVNDLAGAFDKGIVRRASTIASLAEAVGLHGEALARTLARYNGFVESGVDADCGRETLGGGFGRPVKLVTPPFYALPCSAALLSTYCGLRVDTAMRVHDVRGQPIDGLYAAGEVVGGFHGAGYMSGSSLGKAVIFGRIAGRNAAQR